MLVTSAGGVPVLLKDLASVKIGNQPRLGIAGYNGDDDIVQGIVLMQRGARSLPTIQAVKAEIDNGTSSRFSARTHCCSVLVCRTTTRIRRTRSLIWIALRTVNG